MPAKNKIMLFFLPAVLMFALFYLGPMLMGFFYAFTNKSLTGVRALNYQFVGFANFVEMAQDPRFLASVGRTLIFLIFSAIIGQQVCGFSFALLKKGKNTLLAQLMGLAVLMAWIVPEVVAGFALYAYFGDEGMLNTLLQNMGGSKIAWLTAFPLVSVTIANIWRGTAFSMLVYAAALDSIPKELEEAANIEGCSRWQRHLYITLPLVRNTSITNSILVTFQTLGVFGLIYMLTGGGPNGKSQTLPIFMYDQAFIRYQIGYGTAISLVLLLLGALIGIAYVRLEQEGLEG